MSELMQKFADDLWNKERERLERELLAAAGNLIAHAESAQVTIEKDWVSVTVKLIDYQGLKS